VTDRAEQPAWSPRPFLDHLNQRHPDTVLFLARHLTAEPDAVAAALVDVDGARLTVRLDTAEGRRIAAVPLPEPVRSRADLLPQLSEMLRTARAAAPNAPLTSLESQIAARPGHQDR
jgi:Protein of unknown function (DUF2470)